MRVIADLGLQLELIAVTGVSSFTTDAEDRAAGDYTAGADINRLEGSGLISRFFESSMRLRTDFLTQEERRV